MFFIKKFYAQCFLRELCEFCFFPAKYIFSDVETVFTLRTNNDFDFHRVFYFNFNKIAEVEIYTYFCPEKF